MTYMSYKQDSSYFKHAYTQMGTPLSAARLHSCDRDRGIVYAARHTLMSDNVPLPDQSLGSGHP